METVHQIIIESVSGGFIKFCGYWLMTGLIIVAPLKMATILLIEIFKPRK